MDQVAAVCVLGTLLTLTYMPLLLACWCMHIYAAVFAMLSKSLVQPPPQTQIRWPLIRPNHTPWFGWWWGLKPFSFLKKPTKWHKEFEANSCMLGYRCRCWAWLINNHLDWQADRWYDHFFCSYQGQAWFFPLSASDWISSPAWQGPSRTGEKVTSKKDERLYLLGPKKIIGSSRRSVQVSLNDLDRQACEDICGQIIRCRGALLPLGCLPPIGRVGMTTVWSGSGHL